jgi:PAS domain S-box-containing protein
MKVPSSIAPPWEGNEFLDLAEASAGIGVWDVDLATGLVRGRPQFFRVMGLEPRAEPVSIEVFRALRHPDDRAAVLDGFQKALRRHTDYFESEYRIIRPDGQLRWILGRGRVVRDAQGEPVRYSGVDIDITERKRIEIALQDAEERFLRIFQLAPVAMSISTLREGRYIEVNAALLAHTGYSRAEIVGRTARELGVYVDAEDFGRVRKQLAEHGLISNLEITLRGKHDLRTVLLNADVLTLGGEECLLTASIDITERKAAETRQDLLVREMQHRTKNLLAVVQSIASNTLQRGSNLEAFVGRLHALAHAQEFVAEGVRSGVPLRQLVDAQLSPFGHRASVTGEDLIVGGGFAQTFALVLHELATNAAKYGSMSAPDGTVAIEWRIVPKEPEDRLRFSWVERGGPVVAAPAKTGFGTLLMGSLAEARTDFLEAGVEYRFAVPLAEAIRGSA